MCETRNEFKIARNNYKTNVNEEEVPINTRQPKARGEGPRDSEGKNWTKVARGKNEAENSSDKKPRGRPPKKVSSV